MNSVLSCNCFLRRCKIRFINNVGWILFWDSYTFSYNFSKSRCWIIMTHDWLRCFPIITNTRDIIRFWFFRSWSYFIVRLTFSFEKCCNFLRIDCVCFLWISRLMETNKQKKKKKKIKTWNKKYKLKWIWNNDNNLLPITTHNYLHLTYLSFISFLNLMFIRVPK